MSRLHFSLRLLVFRLGIALRASLHCSIWRATISAHRCINTLHTPVSYLSTSKTWLALLAPLHLFLLQLRRHLYFGRLRRWLLNYYVARVTSAAQAAPIILLVKRFLRRRPSCPFASLLSCRVWWRRHRSYLRRLCTK